MLLPTSFPADHFLTAPFPLLISQALDNTLPALSTTYFPVRAFPDLALDCQFPSQSRLCVPDEVYLLYPWRRTTYSHSGPPILSWHLHVHVQCPCKRHYGLNLPTIHESCGVRGRRTPCFVLLLTYCAAFFAFGDERG